MQQKASHLLGLAVENLVGQIVEDIAVGTGQRRDGSREMSGVTPAKGERGQLQPGDPPFGARLERGHVVRR